MFKAILFILVTLFLYSRIEKTLTSERLQHGPYLLEMGNEEHEISGPEGDTLPRMVNITSAEQRLTLLYEKDPVRTINATVIFCDPVEFSELSIFGFSHIQKFFILDDGSPDGLKGITAGADGNHSSMEELQPEEFSVYAVEVNDRVDYLIDIESNSAVSMVDPHWIENSLEYLFAHGIWPYCKSSPALS